jgi:hypothetical protein
MSTKTKTPEKKPAHAANFIAYTVNERNGEQYWTNIGAAFPHKGGDGYSVMLNALPINGRIVLRTPKSDEEQGEE